MNEVTGVQIWAVIASILSAILLISNVIEKVGKAIQLAKAPNNKQNERLDILEANQKSIEEKLHRDKIRLDNLEHENRAGNRVTQRALLALLDHGIDGNNVKQMQDAKEELQNHLINR